MEILNKLTAWVDDLLSPFCSSKDILGVPIAPHPASAIQINDQLSSLRALYQNSSTAQNNIQMQSLMAQNIQHNSWNAYTSTHTALYNQLNAQNIMPNRNIPGYGLGPKNNLSDGDMTIKQYNEGHSYHYGIYIVTPTDGFTFLIRFPTQEMRDWLSENKFHERNTIITYIDSFLIIIQKPNKQDALFFKLSHEVE